MNRFKLEAFMKEFPFLRELDLGRDPEIRVERLDPRWLRERAEERNEETTSVSYREVDKVYLVVVGRAIELLEIVPVGSREQREGETLLEALIRLGEREKVEYLVWNHYIFDHVEEYQGGQLVSLPTRRNEWIILKPKRMKTIAQQITEAKAKAEAEVKREAAF